ncbi:hypothetical protein AWC04_02570 [Mycolicibacterium fallax]|uniref:HTH cro/C1-type domain-containing protein n=1 Tax=Mycolicibacterium fallax TaxID=1793 RepID=A0A1X1RK67_MYCFA|nr:hypothetical protein AWC04_02570 [Mycolicibacterium fallax]
MTEAESAFLTEVGARICARRQQVGLTQADLARLSGLDRAYVNRLERGLNAPTILVLARLGKILEITVSELTAGLSWPE